MTEHLLGLLRVRVIRGINLAVRDIRSSDPYCILRMGKQKLKTSVIRKNINPEWNEDLTLRGRSKSDRQTYMGRNHAHPTFCQEVFDKDLFTFDDAMGYAEFEIRPYVEAVKMKLNDVPNGTTIKKLIPNRQNCLAEESIIYCKDGKIIQDIALRLKRVECGEVEIQLHWVNIPGSIARYQDS